MEQRVVAFTLAIGVASIAGLVWWLTSGSSSERDRRRSRARRQRRADSTHTGENGPSETPTALPTQQAEKNNEALSESHGVVVAEIETSTPSAIESGASGKLESNGTEVASADPSPSESSTGSNSISVVAQQSFSEQASASIESCQEASPNACTESFTPSSSAEDGAEAAANFPEARGALDSSAYLNSVYCLERQTPCTDDAHVTYQVFIDGEVVGRFIGRNGRNIKQLQQTGASVDLSKSAGQARNEWRVCSITGNNSSVQDVLKQIKSRFPSVAKYQVQIVRNHSEFVQSPCPHPGQVLWPDMQASQHNKPVEVNVVETGNPASFHVHLSQHGNVRDLNEMSFCMSAFYRQKNPPTLPAKLGVGSFCAVCVRQEWYRAQIIAGSGDACTVRMVDFGYEAEAEKSNIFPLRSEFCTVPFQAVNCRLAHVHPLLGGDSWDNLPIEVFNLMVRRVTVNKVECQRIASEASTDDDAVQVEMYLSMDKEDTIFVNRNLVDRGCAKWIEASSGTTNGHS